MLTLFGKRREKHKTKQKKSKHLWNSNLQPSHLQVMMLPTELLNFNYTTIQCNTRKILSRIWPCYNTRKFLVLYFILYTSLLLDICLYNCTVQQPLKTKKLLYKTDSQWEPGEEVIEILTIIHWMSTKNT